MRSAFARLVAPLAVLSVLAGCASGPTEEEQAAAAQVRLAELQASAAAARPNISLNADVIEQAAVYLAFTRDIAALRGGFSNAEEIQAALERGAAYDPQQISRGLVAYASILAMQSPAFVTGVQTYARDRDTRNEMVARIVADPSYASRLPGADEAAGLVIGVLEGDVAALRTAADSIENDAYAIQADSRRGWAGVTVADREGRIAEVRRLSERRMQASAQDAARLSAAAYAGSGLGVSGQRLRTPPYPPAVVNGLAIAALALLDGAGENARANTEALMYDRGSLDCLESSKLNLYQCMAASRPSYENVFCLGRHIVRDLGVCARGAALPAGIVTVDAPTQTRAAPAPTPVTPATVRDMTPQTTTPVPVQTPVPRIAPSVVQPQTPSQTTATQRLNSAPPAPQS